MIKKLHIQPIITLAVLIFLTGCGSENHIRTKLTNIDKLQLAIDLDKMKNAATEMGSIAREEWPATVLALETISTFRIGEKHIPLSHDPPFCGLDIPHSVSATDLKSCIP